MASMPRRWATKEEPQIIAVSNINRSARRAWLRMVVLGGKSWRLCRKARNLTTPSRLGMLSAASLARSDNNNRKVHGRIRDSHR